MKFRLTITTLTGCIRYSAIGDRDKLIDGAYDLYGACGVTCIVEG